MTDLIEKRRNKAQDIREGGRRQTACGYEACGDELGNRFLFKKAQKVKGNSGPLIGGGKPLASRPSRRQSSGPNEVSEDTK